MGRKRKNGELIDLVVEKIIKEQTVSTPYIQRKFQVSYIKAQKILKQLAEMGYIETFTEFKEMKVLRKDYIQ
ncbi:MAG TPA: DNA translocase FtsK [Patescibacteria group bacterium]|nr:DNA translocase FtsK [Patescibacteria group bacterium]